jgi:asparagine synthase (glutamine-hydrolysing)
MCGIAGIVEVAGRAVDRNVLQSMARVLEHRGPDGVGYMAQDNVGLAQTRLAIVDLRDIANPPLTNAQQDLWVVLNGEIYNHKELRADLEKQGYSFKTTSDTEVLLALWRRDGVELLQKLRGMFAFAIWDRRDGQFFVARDRLGKKPLYYSFDGQRLAFASEIKSILQLPQQRREPDYIALDSYLSFQYVPAPRTAFKGIQRLPSAHYLLLKQPGDLKICRYWRDEAAPIVFASRQDAREQLLSSLREAVKLRMRADVPVGAFLSGGIDSGLIVALMSELAHGAVRTVSVGFAEETHNELPFAKEVAQRYATDHHEIVLTPDHAQAVRKLVWHLDEPFADSSILPTYYVSQAAREVVTVALSGDGGDEVFAGYRHYFDMLSLGRADVVPLMLRRPLLHTLARVLPDRQARMLRYLGDALPRRYRRFLSVVKDEEKRQLYSRQFTERLESSQYFTDFETIEASAKDPLTWMMKHDRSHYLADGLMKKTDTASMAVSLEVRCPLLDHELLAKANALPAAWHVANGRGKAALRDIATAFLPTTIMHKPKTGFAVPLAGWLRGPLQGLLMEHLSDQRFAARGLFNLREIERMLSEHMTAKRNWSNRLWSLLMLELWFRTFIDGEATVVR